jgi:hypothetical protein
MYEPQLWRGTPREVAGPAMPGNSAAGTGQNAP